MQNNQDIPIQSKEIYGKVSNYNCHQVKIQAFAIDKRENCSCDFDLIIRQGSQETGIEFDIALSVNDLKEILEACTGTLIGKKSGDDIIYTAQKQQVIQFFREQEALIKGLAESDGVCVRFLHEHMAAIKDPGVDDEDRYIIQFDNSIIKMFQLLCLFASLEVMDTD